jgi:hypothetical protein
MSEFDDEMEKLTTDWADDPDGRDRDCLRNHRGLTLHLIREGFRDFEVRKQRELRNYFKKNVLKPEFMETAPTVPLRKVKVKTSEKTMRHIIGGAVELFAGWKIGRLEIGKATKDILLTEAKHERARGTGHIANAIIYEKLAQPMDDKQTVANYWKSPEAVKLIRDEVINGIEKKRDDFAGGAHLTPAE